VALDVLFQHYLIPWRQQFVHKPPRPLPTLSDNYNWFFNNVQKFKKVVVSILENTTQYGAMTMKFKKFKKYKRRK
jgi:hypothetical protein